MHPAKKEIRFREEAKVRNFLLRSLIDHNRCLSGTQNLGKSSIQFESDPESSKVVPRIDSAALNFYGLKKEDQPKDKDLFSEKPNTPPLQSSENNSHPFTQDLIPEEFVGAKGDGLASWRLIDCPKGDLGLFQHQMD